MLRIKATIIGLLASIFTMSAETVTNASAGGLKDKIGANASEISELKITGPLNAEDIATLKTMALPDSGKLAVIDLSGTMLLAIGDEAFSECTNLQKIILPSSITQIGRSAFGGCKNLTSINIPEKVTSIGEYAFAECEKMTSFTIPQGVTVISAGCFADCSALENINLPKQTQQIGKEAFARCKNLKNIEIPAGTNTIGGAVFAGCESLSFIKVDPNNKKYCATAGGVLYSKDGKYILQYPAGKTGDVYTIPPGVVRVGSYAFSGNKYIKKITIPTSCTAVGYGAFYECTNLNELELPNNIDVIGSDMFYNCNNLEKLTIPSSVTKINPNAFYGCSKLKQIILPSNLKTIGKQSFHGCSSLESIAIPEGVEELPQSCFALCSNLKEIKLPNSLTNIAEMAFAGDTALKMLKLPQNVKVIEGGAFASCSGLENIIFPASLKTIGFAAFVNCSKIEVLTIPASVDSIGVSSIVGCESLKEIRIESAIPPKTNILANFNVSDTLQITVPEGKEEDFHKALGWKEFRHINKKVYEVEHPDMDTDINDRLSLVGGENMEENFLVYSSIANETKGETIIYDNSIYEQNEVDEKAHFVNGESALTTYLKSNVSYPAQAKGKRGIVVIGFVVEKDGAISNLKVKQSQGDELDAEAVSAVYAMPKWIAAQKDGQAVRSNTELKINVSK